MTQYTDPARLRAEAASAAQPVTGPNSRLTLTRRPLLDLPAMSLAPSLVAAQPSIAAPTPATIPMMPAAAQHSSPAPSPADALDELRLKMDGEFETASGFDVPAFLRRQEG